jgi:hypothetical protein
MRPVIPSNPRSASSAAGAHKSTLLDGKSNPVRLVVERDGLADYVLRPAEMSPPQTVTQNDGALTPRPVFLTRKDAAQTRRSAQ